MESSPSVKEDVDEPSRRFPVGGGNDGYSKVSIEGKGTLTSHHHAVEGFWRT